MEVICLWCEHLIRALKHFRRSNFTVRIITSPLIKLATHLRACVVPNSKGLLYTANCTLKNRLTTRCTGIIFCSAVFRFPRIYYTLYRTIISNHHQPK